MSDVTGLGVASFDARMVCYAFGYYKYLCKLGPYLGRQNSMLSVVYQLILLQPSFGFQIYRVIDNALV